MDLALEEGWWKKKVMVGGGSDFLSALGLATWGSGPAFNSGLIATFFFATIHLVDHNFCRLNSVTLR